MLTQTDMLKRHTVSDAPGPQLGKQLDSQEEEVGLGLSQKFDSLTPLECVVLVQTSVVGAKAFDLEAEEFNFGAR
jgi:hypothetical protein